MKNKKQLTSDVYNIYNIYNIYPVPKDPIKFAWTIAKLLFLKEVKEKMFYLTRKKKQQQQ